MKRWVCASLLTLLAASIGSRAASAQTLCYPIVQGDTAARIAERLTGDPRNRRAPWFEIVDERWRLISKADYGSIRPGWLACVASTRPAVLVQGPHQSPTVGAVRETVEPAATLAGAVDFTFLFVAASLLAAVLLLRYGTRRARHRRERTGEMQRFGARFVQEFARPQSHCRGVTAPRARLRVSPRRACVEVLLAPGDGGSYPNLADHRGNVEYDVARVMATVAGDAFVTAPPYAEGQWVVLPFHFKGPVKREVIR